MLKAIDSLQFRDLLLLRLILSVPHKTGMEYIQLYNQFLKDQGIGLELAAPIGSGYRFQQMIRKLRRFDLIVTRPNRQPYELTEQGQALMMKLGVRWSLYPLAIPAPGNILDLQHMTWLGESHG